MAFKDTSSSEERARFFRGDCAHCGKAHTCTHTCARRVHTHTCTCRLQAPGLAPAARLRVRRRDCGAGVLLFLGVCHGNQGTDHLRRFFAPAAAWHPPEGSAGRLSSHPHAVRRHPALPGCPLPQGASLPPCTPPSLHPSLPHPAHAKALVPAEGAGRPRPAWRDPDTGLRGDSPLAPQFRATSASRIGGAGGSGDSPGAHPAFLNLDFFNQSVRSTQGRARKLSGASGAEPPACSGFGRAELAPGARPAAAMPPTRGRPRHAAVAARPAATRERLSPRHRTRARRSSPAGAITGERPGCPAPLGPRRQGEQRGHGLGEPHSAADRRLRHVVPGEKPSAPPSRSPQPARAGPRPARSLRDVLTLGPWRPLSPGLLASTGATRCRRQSRPCCCSGHSQRPLTRLPCTQHARRRVRHGASAQ